MPINLASTPDNNPSKKGTTHTQEINQDPELTALLEKAIEAVSDLLSDTSEQNDETQDVMPSKPKK